MQPHSATACRNSQLDIGGGFVHVHAIASSLILSSLSPLNPSPCDNGHLRNSTRRIKTTHAGIAPVMRNFRPNSLWDACQNFEIRVRCEQTRTERFRCSSCRRSTSKRISKYISAPHGGFGNSIYRIRSSWVGLLICILKREVHPWVRLIGCSCLAGGKFERVLLHSRGI